MNYLGDRYISVYRYKGFDICTLKKAVPSEGDSLDYVIDAEEFAGETFLHPDSAIDAINIRIRKMLRNGFNTINELKEKDNI